MNLEITEEQFTKLAEQYGYAKCIQASAEQCRTKFERIKPTKNKFYWYLSQDGEVWRSTWDGCSSDKHRWSMDNVYLTREAAKLALDRQLAKVRVIDKLRGVKLDWDDVLQVKYALALNTSTGKIFRKSTQYAQIAERELYSTEEACDWVAEHMSEDVRLMLTGER